MNPQSPEHPETSDWGPLSQRRAHWVNRDTILWNPRVEGEFAPLQIDLHVSMDGGWRSIEDVVDGNGEPRDGEARGGEARGGEARDGEARDGEPRGSEARGSEARGREVGKPVASLTLIEGGADEEVRARFPHLTNLAAWRLTTGRKEWLRGQLVLRASQSKETLDSTGVQIAGVLDDLYTYAGPLGLQWSEGRPQLYLWAPTAQRVSLRIYDEPEDSVDSGKVVPMYRGLPREEDVSSDETDNRDGHETEGREIHGHETDGREIDSRETDPLAEASREPGWDGVWSIEGDATWKNKYFLFEVVVFAPETGRVETNLVTDPYSRSLSTNSTKSQFIDFDDDDLAPPGWHDHRPPALHSFHDIVIYELHVRDFSAMDESTTEATRGTFLAFTEDTVPTRHLRSLAEAGITHLHLLPVFDNATIPEERAFWPPPMDFPDLAPDSDEPQRQLEQRRADDGYNWGYDPLHYGVPDGSYCVESQGRSRTLEFRRMVDAIHGMGLRLILDVVYNHTYAAGQDEKSVLDRIVPGYYYRLDAEGELETSTCCPNIASEHAMVERLIGDDLVHWARHYKVDGFRFDLMGHHMRHNVERWRDRLRELRLESDGVDGPQIFLYGEGWDFGEVKGGARGFNASQWHMGGTGVGTFNDRLRDGLRGGGVTGDIREPGFITGLHVDPGFRWTEDPQHERGVLDEHVDKIRSGLAGNLAEYTFVDRSGHRRPAWESAQAYAHNPTESIQYVSAHDNETLYDKVLLSAPEGTKRIDRIRMHRLGLAVIALSQGIPFFHAGCEILRSKSLDRDSYDSGDWFNRLDYTLQWHNFGRGLPPAEKNEANWPALHPLLQRLELRPTEEEMRGTSRYFEALLRVRRSSPLFRLSSLEDVQRRVKFHNTGPEALPGVLAMSLSDEEDASIDSARKGIVVFFNACPEEIEFTLAPLTGRTLDLDPQLREADEKLEGASFDSSTGRFVIPSRTTAVFFEPR